MLVQDEVAEVAEIIRYTLYTDYVKLDLTRKEVPTSLLLIAPPESVKTTMVDQYDPNQGLYFINDCTAWGIQHELLKRMKEGEIKRLCIPDLVNPTNRKQETVNALVTFLNSYISWEGIKSILTFAMQIELDEPVRGSVITTVTPHDFKRIVSNIAAIGFLSRLTPVTYQYSDDAIDRIFKGIFEQNDNWSKIKLHLPKNKTEITIEHSLAKQTESIARVIGKQASATGFRAARTLMTLCRARALSEKRDRVSQGDVDRIIYLAIKFIKLPPELIGHGE